MTSEKPTLAVVGHGMVGHRFLEACVARGLADTWRIHVYGDERHPAYDRIGLSRYFEGTPLTDFHLDDRSFRGLLNVRLELGVGVLGINPEKQTLRLSDGRAQHYDALVLATGATPFIPPIAGVDAAGVFVYRGLDDLTAIAGGAADATEGIVLGGGLLGLEAANALRLLGLRTTVVELAPWLLPVQVDEGGGAVLRGYVEKLGLDIRTGVSVKSLEAGCGDRVSGATLSDGKSVSGQVVVVAAGVRPHDALARAAGLAVGERGGVVIDEACRTSDASIYAIGDVAAFGGRAVGLVAPGYAMAEVVADRLAGGQATFAGADVSTALKLLGADVASVGDAHGATDGALSLVFADPVAGTYRKLVVSDDGKKLLGGVFVGDTEPYAEVRALVAAGGAVEGSPQDLLLPVRGDVPQRGLPDAAQVCTCNNVTALAIREAVRDGLAESVPAMKACTRAGTSCGSCVPTVKRLIDAELAKAGREVSRALCEHFPLSRQDLYSLMRLRNLTTWSATVRELGQGEGCDICKPTVASILATLAPKHVLEGEMASLQDTNDHLMANMQKDGTYSVVPRLPGGEVTPEQLAAISATAAEFGLYVKITGAQRIDLFGAHARQLPQIWQRLVDAGMESGHAYGKALRTVKSCVGDTWCRFGVGDSVGMAIELELRYRGLRAPHKLKSGVSGCARECAEARGKDFGIIATDTGWNLYVCGNGGFTPRHAQLLASDLDHDTLIRYIDRFLMFYIRTADRLQRTAPWLESLEGGLDYLRAVVVEDSLGIAAELEADMGRHVADYRDEWAATLEDPDKLRRFVSFVNAPDSDDPNVVHIPERRMHRAARGEERPEGEILVSGPVIPVGAR